MYRRWVKKERWEDQTGFMYQRKYRTVVFAESRVAALSIIYCMTSCGTWNDFDFCLTPLFSPFSCWLDLSISKVSSYVKVNFSDKSTMFWCWERGIFCIFYHLLTSSSFKGKKRRRKFDVTDNASKRSLVSESNSKLTVDYFIKSAFHSSYFKPTERNVCIHGKFSIVEVFIPLRDIQTFWDQDLHLHLSVYGGLPVHITLRKKALQMAWWPMFVINTHIGFNPRLSSLVAVYQFGTFSLTLEKLFSSAK